MGTKTINSVLWLARFNQKISPSEPEPSRRFNLLFTVEGSGIQGIF
jgi:hypothetical protein